MAVAALHRLDEGEAEPGLVGVVEFGEAGELLGAAFVNPGAGLLGGAGGGQFATDRCFAGEVRVGVDQRQLGLAACRQENVGHALVQALDIVEAVVDAQVIGLLGDPGGVFVDVGEGFDEGLAGQRGGGQGLETAHASVSWKGCSRCQWRAMSSRRANQTLSWLCAYWMKRSRAAIRAGRPINRQCRPMESIFGAVAPSS